MSEAMILTVLYLAGILVLVAEIFIPSHGILTVVGIGLLVAGIVRTFMDFGREAGVVAVLACMIVVPCMAGVAIRYWHRTPFGRRISPPNPVLSTADVGVPVADLERLVGQTGKAVSTLRPVGVCDFGGQRVSCVAELGMIAPGTTVQAVRVSGPNLAVIEKKT
ncbi:MAG TPA: NfeD family protein [Phycisphaerae bacterium]|nr:NfeD family protein [Phycisphaerae bacterium]HNU45093.1 NfeD family protein [Phycisphaerae bacterium]